MPNDSHTPLIPIAHYGLHTHEHVAFLHQGSRNAPNFVGLKRLSPFHQKPEGMKACPHLINVSSPMPDRTHWEFFCRLYPDPLVQEMLPLPKQKFALIAYVNDPNNDLAMAITILAKLSSPLYDVVHPLMSLTEKMILEKLNLTNVAPLILTGVETHNQTFINKLVKEAQLRPRRLILTGASEVVIREPMRRIQTHLHHIDNRELVQLPMEQIGVAVLRRYLRDEVIDAPYERKENGNL